MRFYRHKEYLVRGGPGISSIFSFFFGFPLKERGKIQKRIGSNKKRILLFSSVSPRVRWSKSVSKRRSLVRSVDLPWFLQLDLQPLHPDLETIHRLYRSLSRCGIVKTDKAKALALVSRAVNKHLWADDVAKGEKHLHQFCIAKLLWQVVDEEITPVRARNRATDSRNGKGREGVLDGALFWSRNSPMVLLKVGVRDTRLWKHCRVLTLWGQVRGKTLGKSRDDAWHWGKLGTWRVGMGSRKLLVKEQGVEQAEVVGLWHHLHGAARDPLLLLLPRPLRLFFVKISPFSLDLAFCLVLRLLSSAPRAPGSSFEEIPEQPLVGQIQFFPQLILLFHSITVYVNVHLWH